MTSSAFEDLRTLRDFLDSALVGWIGARTEMTTETGKDAMKDAIRLRERAYRAWGENIVLRARLSRALADNDGLRDCNAELTAEVMAYEEKNA